MVSIFTGAGTGFERGSGSVLGGAGLLGSGAMGRAGEQVMLNAATGNLLISRQDEYLVGRGLDAAVARTYNSLGDLSDDNGDNWRQSTQRQIRDLTGVVNSWGSTVKRVSGDGSIITYAFDGAGYVATDGAGAHDRITYDGTWRWTDGDSRAVEVYGGPNNQISQLIDTSGNTLSYSYSGNQLSDITTANGERIHYGWSGNNLTEINTVYHDGSNWRQLTRVRYDYDGYGRLTTVTVDLTPEDNSIADGNRYVTSYEYLGSTKLVSAINQSDGSRLGIGYDGHNRVTSLIQTVADGISRTTSIGYGAGYTNVTDPQGQTTRLDYATDNFAVDVDTWGRAATLTRDPATIDGRRATRLTIQNGGEWAGNYQGFAVTAGETLTFGLTLQAQGSVTEHDLGLYSDQTGWGAAGISHARIVSGPGRIEQIAGGIWRVVGLSTTTGTRVEITRTYDQSGSGGAYFYVDNPGGYRAGVSLLAADATLTRSADAGDLGQMNLDNWGYGAVSRTPVGSIDGGPAYQYTTHTAGQWPGIYSGLNARKGDQFALAISLQAVNGESTQDLGLWGNATGWGDPSWASARILSGPGTITNIGGGIFRVSGLSNSQPTRVQIIRTYDRDESGGAYFYVDNPNGYRAGVSLIAGAPMLTRLSPRPSATAGQLLSVTLPPAQNGAPQQVVRFAYDAAGNLASTSNAAGTTRFGYDERGNVVRVEDPNGSVTTRIYEARNLLLAETVTGSDQNGTAAAHTKRFAYDGAGRLRYAVDEEGGVTEYAYDGAGQVHAVGRFANVRYDTTGWSPGQLLDLGTVDNWKAQVDKSSVHVTYTPLDGRGNVVQEIVYGATGADGSWQTYNGYTHRYFTRDQAGQVLSRVDAGKNAETFVYDGLGRVVASTDTGGATTRISFQDGAQRTVVTLASGMVTTSTYNRAGELVAEATGGHYHQGGSASYAYDSLGRLRVETDATGLSTAYVYDRLNRKVAELNRDGWMTEYRYDTADRLVATVRYTHVMAGWQRDAAFDPNHSPQVADLRPPAHAQDIWLWNVYDAGGRLVETIGGDGSATIFEYDASDRLVRTIAYATKLEGWRVDAYKTNPPAALQGPPGSVADSVERRFYDRAGRLVGTLDGEGRLTRTGWDAIGEKVEEVHHASPVADHLRAHGSFAQLLASAGTHQNDASTRWVYDNQGHLRYEIDALGRVTEYGYEYEGWKWSAFGPLRQTVRYAGSIAALGSYTIDSVRQAIANAGLAGHGGNRVSQAVYDGAGRLVYAIDPEGAVTGYRYDQMGNVVRKVEYGDRRGVGGLPDEGGMNAWQDGVIGNAANRITRNYYSASGQLRFVVDGEGYVTRNDYDAEGRLTFAVRWNNPVGAADWWSIDSVAGSVGGEWAGTTYGYNVDGRLSRVTDGIGVTKEYWYWANGTLAWEITASGMAEESRVHHVYDGSGREVVRYDAMWSADQMATQYAYDGRGNLVSTTDAAGRTTTRGYDRAGQLTSVTDALGGVTGYAYDGLGNRVRETDPRGASTWSYYDKASRVVAVRDAENYVTETSYTVFGEVATVTRRANQSWTGQGPDWPHVNAHGADATTRFSYDKLGRATITWDAEGYVEQRWYDAFGNVVQDQNKAGGMTRRVFDRRGLMVAESTPASSIDVWGGTVAREAAITRFDVAYYRAANGDIAHYSDAALVDHWQNHGWRERRNPNAFFNTRYYLDNNPDVAAAGVNPLDHYRDWGIREGRRPAGEAAATSTVLVGSPAGRFDAAYYRAANADIAHYSDAALFDHWQNHGWRERRNPNAFFNTSYYLTTYGDVAAAGINPLDHYRDAGIGEGRRPAQTVAAATLTGGTVTRFEYDARGNLLRRVEAAGLPEQRITSHAYDKADRLVETRGDAVHWVDQGGYNVQGPTQPIERRRYDGRGNLVELTDARGARGARTLMFYDKLGRKTEQVDAVAGLVSWRYDAVGNLTHERRWALRTPNPDAAQHPGVTAEDRVTDYTYDRLNRMTSSIVRGVRTGNWNGSYYYTGVNDVTTSYDYDASGNVLRVIDGAGGMTYTTYDRLGRRTRQVDAEGYITGWLYDAEGNVHHERRWAARSPGYGVGWSNDPGVSGEDRVTDFTHDKMGRRLTETRRGVVAYAADGNGNLYGVSSDATVSYQYNGLGQVTRRAEATGEATVYEYDAAGRLAHETRAGYHDQDGVWTQPLVTYRYNGLGDVTLTEQTRQGGGEARVVRYGYTAGGRLHTMTDATGTVFTYWQDIAGAEVIQTWNRNRSDGSVQHEGVMYTRDALGRVQSQATGWHNGAWNKGDVQETRYNVFGDVSQRGINGLQEDFAYDNRGNLARTNSGDGVWRYFVSDGAGRRTITLENQKRDDMAGTSVDQALHIASNWSQTPMDQAYVDGVAATIAVYDRRGQQVATRLPNRELAAGQVQSLELAASYTPFGELAWERDATGATTYYGYNTMGRRTMAQRAAVIVTDEAGNSYWTDPIERSYYDAGGRLVGQDDANGRRTTRHLLAGTGYGTSEGLVTAEFHADGGVRRFAYDRFGDQRRATDEIGRTTTMHYDAAGRLIQQIRPSGHWDYYGYDVLGQRLWHVNSHLGWGERETSDYDHQGRVTSTRAFGGEVTSTSYSWIGGISTGGMGTFGGWQQVTSNANGFERLEQSDVFGRTVYAYDHMPYVTLYHTRTDYDRGGRMVSRSGNEGETVSYSWYNTGLLSAQWSDLNLGYQAAVSRYGYDAAGRKTSESFWREGRQLTQSSASYDALGRMTYWHQAETSLPWATMSWAFDAVGNVRRTVAEKAVLDQNGAVAGRSSEDRWFRYDAMNRVTLDGGVLSGGQIVRGWSGTSLTYDHAGQRVGSTRDASLYGQVWVYEPYQGGGYYNEYYYDDPDRGRWVWRDAYYQGERQESFGYAADGQLTSVGIAETGYYDDGNGNAISTGMLDRHGGRAEFQFDGMGRQTRQLDYNASGQVAYDHQQWYSAAGRVERDHSVRLEAGATLTADTWNDYGGNAALGQVVSATTYSYRNGQHQGTTSYSNAYNWRNGGAQIASTSTWGQTSSSTSYNYGAGGRLESISISDGRPRTIYITGDLSGQVLTRDEYDNNYNVGDPHERWYRFNGNELGHLGNDGTWASDYAGSIQTRGYVQQNGALGNNRRYGYGFSESIDQITSYEQGASGGGYTVRAGDTLAGIAAQVWGDASLWYKLASANGLGANSALTPGQTLTLPAGVIRSTYNAEQLRPYDPADAIGDVSPVSAQPTAKAKKNKCGAFGKILLVAVAVAVAVVSSGALAAASISAVGGGSVGLGAGISAAFGGTVLAGAGATVAAGTAFSLTAGGLIAVGAAAGAIGSIASQGVGVATGIQDKFSWKGVALAGIAGGVGGALGAGNIVGTVGGKFTTAAVNGAVRGALSNAAIQGVALATGLQGKFDWVGIAAGAAVGAAAGGVRTRVADTVGGRLLSGMAGALAGGAARSIVNGSSFGDNVLAALPDVIGQTIGGYLADRVTTAAIRAEARGRYREIMATGEGEAFLQLAGFDPSRPPSPSDLLDALSITAGNADGGSIGRIKGRIGGWLHDEFERARGLPNASFGSAALHVNTAIQLIYSALATEVPQFQWTYLGGVVAKQVRGEIERLATFAAGGQLAGDLAPMAGVLGGVAGLAGKTTQQISEHMIGKLIGGQITVATDVGSYALAYRRYGADTVARIAPDQSIRTAFRIQAAADRAGGERGAALGREAAFRIGVFEQQQLQPMWDDLILRTAAWGMQKIGMLNTDITTPIGVIATPPGLPNGPWDVNNRIGIAGNGFSFMRDHVFRPGAGSAGGQAMRRYFDDVWRAGQPRWAPPSRSGT